MSEAIQIPAPSINPIAGSKSGLLDLTMFPSERAWELAIDCVDYPVMLKPLLFRHEGTLHDASGATNTGRDCTFHGVVVDRDRDGVLSTISAVTGQYSTPSTPDIYRSLHRDLLASDLTGRPSSIYVTGDGGKQEMLVGIDGAEWVNGDDRIRLNIVLRTSVDGRQRHLVTLAALNADTGIEVLGLNHANFSLAARHTKAIHGRQAAFAAIIGGLLDRWNDEIIPSMIVMNDCQFDKQAAVSILGSIMEAAEIPDVHQEGANGHFQAAINQGPDKQTLFRVLNSLSEYLEDALGNRQERLRLLKEQINKAVSEVRKTL